MQGIKHLIQCHCILPQYRKRKNPIFHQFVAFSVIDDEDNIVPKYVECNNCSAVHCINEIGKSEIVINRDGVPSQRTIADIALSLPEGIREVLKSYNADLSTYEEVEFYFDQALTTNVWEKEIIIQKETILGVTQGKFLKLIGPARVRIDSFTRDEFIS